MNDDELMALVGEVFDGLAGVLEPQPASAWDAPSLCELWLVRNVIAHVSNAARYSAEAYMAEVQADGGDFGKTGDRLAVRDGRLEPEVLLADLRDEQLHRWMPPGGGAGGALTHAVIHGLDATTPLGIDPWVPDEARRQVLGTLTEGGVHAMFGVQIDGVQLAATDLDWTYGDGRPVTATADDLISVLSGRQIDPDRVTGSMP